VRRFFFFLRRFLDVFGWDLCGGNELFTRGAEGFFVESDVYLPDSRYMRYVVLGIFLFLICFEIFLCRFCAFLNKGGSKTPQ
jgi:hypothetical protein